MNLANLEEIAHSESLKDHIRQEIMAAGGVISFAHFMHLALYAPGLGYYSAGRQKLGKAGDFLTAPEISPLFAQCVASQCQQILTALPDGGDILELGAGSGIFVKDLLLELKEQGSLPNHYFILEVSADLRERQKNLLEMYCPDLIARVHWLDRLPEIPINGIIFANEVMDALPCHCFRIENREVKERSVTWHQEGFVWKTTEPDAELKEKVESVIDLDSLPEGYESEMNLMLPAWINSMSAMLNKGVILLFDYGYGRAEYYHPDRSMGTLMCYHQQRRHSDPFILVGEQDMTAHVDFTSVIEAAVESGCELLGYTTQAAFLLAMGLLDLADMKTASVIEQVKQAEMIKKLILPAEMGEAVKVMALGKQFEMPLMGFALMERSRDL